MLDGKEKKLGSFDFQVGNVVFEYKIVCRELY